MLELTIVTKGEQFNEDTLEFIDAETITIALNHSLYAMAQWESKWKLPFLTKDEKTDEQTLDYIETMIVDRGFNRSYLNRLTQEHIHAVEAYINDPMSAVVINQAPTKGPSRITIPYAEVIYSQMFQFQIDMSCEHWHLNRLLTLIRVCAIRSNPDDKMPAATRNKTNAELNAQRKQAMKTTG